MKPIGNASFALKGLTAIVLSLAFITYPGQRISTAAPRVTTINTTLNDLKLRSESQLKAEAALYDTAMLEIGRIASMRLATMAELERANAIVGKHGPNLKYNRSKLISLGLGDSTFINGVKARNRDTKAQQEFAVELAQDPTSIFRVSGGQTLSERMRRSVNGDVAKIQQVAAHLKKAAADIRAKTKAHHASSVSLGFMGVGEPGYAKPLFPSLNITLAALGLVAITVAVITVRPVGLAIVNIASPPTTTVRVVVVTPAVVAAAARLLDKLVENAGTEEGRDRVQACHDKAERQLSRCNKAAAEMGLFRAVGEAACYADWLIAAAACWVS